jgi:glucose/arabinose dehydrogenase
MTNVHRNRIFPTLLLLSGLFACTQESPDSPESSQKSSEGPVDTVSGASPVAGVDEPVEIVVEAGDQQLVLEEVLRTGEVIWAMDFIDAGTMIFSERVGRLKLLDLASGEVTPLQGGPVVMQTPSGGLFDVLVDPDFANNRQIYFTYVKDVGEGRSAIALARANLAGTKLIETTDLFVANNASDDHAHWGSRVVMDEQRYLYMTSGDRHVPDNAQNLLSHGGKVLRLNEDGSPPADNPFAGRDDAAPEIWSYGHRNPQGLVIHARSGELYEQEHGPTGGDEINIIEKGHNYGWPVITYGENIWGGQEAEGTEREGLEQPLKYFLPGIAPTGMCFYFGERYPDWQGDLFSSTLRGHVTRLRLEGSQVLEEERVLQDWGERLRDVVEAPDGLLYMATETGAIARLAPTQ